MARPAGVQAGSPGSDGEAQRSPLWRWWNEEQGNAHTIIVGMSGSPKTTSVLLLHLVTDEKPTQVVVSAPVGTLAAQQEGA